MAITMEEVRRLTIEARTKGVDAVAGELTRLTGASREAAAAAGDLAAAETKTATTMESSARSWQRFVLQNDEAARAQDRLEKAQQRVLRALAAGAASPQDAARQLGLLAEKYGQAGAAAAKSASAVEAHAGAAELNRTQLLMLGSAAKHSIESFAAGAPAMTILTQQGVEVAQAFSMGSGGLGGTLRAVGGAIAGLIGPTVAVTASMVALGAGGLYAWTSWRSSLHEIETSLDGIGRRSAMTAGGLANLARAVAPGAGLSQSSAMGLAAGYARAGLRGDVIEGALGVTKRFAQVSGVDLSEAGKTLAAALADPTRGLEQLNAQLGFADERTRVLVASFAAAGNVTRAQKELIDALGRDLNAASEHMSSLAKGWEWVKRVASNTATAAGKGIDEALGNETPEDRLQRLVRERQQLAAERSTPIASGAGRWGLTQRGVDAASDAKAADLDRQLRLAQKAVDRANDEASARATEQDLNRRSLTTAQDVYAVNPEIERRRQLDAEIVRLEAAANNPELQRRMGLGVREINAALAATKDARTEIVGLMEREAAAAELNLRSIQARTVAERAAVAAERELSGLKAGQVDPAARARSQAAAAAIAAQAVREAEDRLRSANDNAAVAGLPNYARAQAEIEQRWKRQNELDAGSPEALAKNQAARRAELDALQRSQITGPINDANRALESQNRLLLVEAQTFGMSTGEVVKARTAQEMLNRFIEAGVPITDQMRASVEAYARGMGTAAQAAEDLQKRQQAVIAGMDDLRGLSTNVFSMAMHGRSGADILRTIGDHAIDKGANFLTAQLFGEQGKAGGGLFGDVLGGLFGKSQGIAVGSATVTAGTVNVMGAIAGLPGNAVPGAPGTGSTYTSAPLPPVGMAANANGPWSPQDYLGRMYRIESGGDPTNRTGSNFGIAQFGYADMRQFGLSNPFDVGQATTASLMEARRNAAALRGVLGRDATGADLYLAHQQGLAGASALFKNPDMPAWQAIRPFYGSDAIAQSAITGNMGRLDMTSSQFTQMWANRFNATAPLDLSQFSGATQALQQFQSTTQAATSNLGGFGQSLGQMASSLVGGVGGKSGGGGGLFASLFSLFGFARGGAFGAGSVIPFANGDVFGAPTVFPMAGGRTGLLGEAGPEAIMPLARDGQGRLGVRTTGAAVASRVSQTAVRSTVVIGGHSITIQGNADKSTVEELRAELDRRDANTRRWVEQSALGINQKTSRMRG